MVKKSCSEIQKCEKDDAKTVTYGSKRSSANLAGKRKSRKCSKEKRSNNKKQKLDPKHMISFTPQEEELVIQIHSTIGSRWSIIADQLSGQTENDVKILWNSKLRKRLCAMGIDPVTHKPFSQILIDYGNIGAIPKTRT